MSVLTSTGTILSVVADEPATIDAAGFGALTFVEVGEVTDIPEYGPNVQVVEHNPLKTGVTQKFKGFINYSWHRMLLTLARLFCLMVLRVQPRMMSIPSVSNIKTVRLITSLARFSVIPQTLVQLIQW